MSLGGNLSSGYTNQLTDNALYCGISKSASIAYSDPCYNSGTYARGIDASGNPVPKPTASYSSMYLQSKTCLPPTPAELALYPKVAVPSSIRTQTIANKVCAILPDPGARFAQYQRFQVPVPCPPLNPSANMAGKSLPSSLQCNIYPNT
jgi:hypothetical protein